MFSIKHKFLYSIMFSIKHYVIDTFPVYHFKELFSLHGEGKILWDQIH